GTTNTEKPQAKLTSLGFFIACDLCQRRAALQPRLPEWLDGIHTEASSQHRWHPVIFRKPLTG
ncbi:MAG: hypothetical protein JL55_30775, partial [Pseudomonas sp. BICA1-14]